LVITKFSLWGFIYCSENPIKLFYLPSKMILSLWNVFYLVMGNFKTILNSPDVVCVNAQTSKQIFSPRSSCRCHLQSKATPYGFSKILLSMTNCVIIINSVNCFLSEWKHVHPWFSIARVIKLRIPILEATLYSCRVGQFKPPFSTILKWCHLRAAMK